MTAPALGWDWSSGGGWSPPGPDLVAKAEGVFRAQSWHVFRTADLDQARRYIAGLVQPADLVAVHESRAWERTAVEAALRAKGVSVQRYGPIGAGRGASGGREALLAAQIGVTGAVALVAETGSALIAADDAYGQLVSNLPYTHVVVAPTFKLVATLSDGLWLVRRFAERVLGREMPRYLGSVSGPSRTGDIEMVIVQGMHGPGRVHLVLLDVEPDSEMLGDLPADLLYQ